MTISDTDSAAANSAATKALDIEVRLSALEYFCCQLLSDFIDLSRRSDEEIDGVHRRMLAHVVHPKIVRLSPEYADLPVSDLHYAVRCLISMHREMLGLSRRLDV